MTYYPENEGKVAVFDTEAEALAAESHCHANWIAEHPQENGYVCERWAVPRQRVDGKWDFPVCPHTDTTGATNIEDLDLSNYPVEE